jgi:hypothetical protein
MKHTYVFFLTIAILVGGCGDSETTGSNWSIPIMSSSPAAVLFTATDVTFSSSKLYRFDYDPKAVDEGVVGEPMLAGSSDMVLFESKQRLFVFNRSAQDLNFRQIYTVKEGERYRWVFGKQILTPAALAGDPHDVLVLNDELMMLANYVKGVLAVVNYKSGELQQVINISRKLVGQGPFRPESLSRISDTRVGVLHQGYDEKYALNHSQGALQLMRGDDNRWQWDERAAATKLKVSIPQGLFKIDAEKFVTVGLCFIGVDSCRAGIEQLDFATGKAEVVLPFKNTEMTYYGAPVALSGGRLIMNAQHHDGKQTNTSLTMIDAGSKQVERLYDFPSQETSGYWGYTADKVGQYVFFGDPAAGGKGSLFIYDLKRKALLGKRKTDLTPYSMRVILPDQILE